ncbi:hypothetical protein FOA52_004042 [Chlamydomonas sp. UWO 241]|nr:hypothetical protein FOA52_004042 [Chlamydomonas sp. UWO 241]
MYTARATFDGCNGHTARGGAYHYHTEPLDGCLFNFTITAGQHSPFWGVMADGISISGELGDGGVAPTDLDICGGHVDATRPYYHYHSVSAAPCAVRYLRGCLPTGISGFGSVQSSASSSCDAAAVQYDPLSLPPRLLVSHVMPNMPVAPAKDVEMGVCVDILLPGQCMSISSASRAPTTQASTSTSTGLELDDTVHSTF